MRSFPRSRREASTSIPGAEMPPACPESRQVGLDWTTPNVQGRLAVLQKAWATNIGAWLRHSVLVLVLEHRAWNTLRCSLPCVCIAHRHGVAWEVWGCTGMRAQAMHRHGVGLRSAWHGFVFVSSAHAGGQQGSSPFATGPTHPARLPGVSPLADDRERTARTGHISSTSLGSEGSGSGPLQARGTRRAREKVVAPAVPS